MPVQSGHEKSEGWINARAEKDNQVLYWAVKRIFHLALKRFNSAGQGIGYYKHPAIRKNWKLSTQVTLYIYRLQEKYGPEGFEVLHKIITPLVIDGIPRKLREVEEEVWDWYERHYEGQDKLKRTYYPTWTMKDFFKQCCSWVLVLIVVTVVIVIVNYILVH